MSEALRHQKVKEAQEDFELAIRKFRAACEKNGIGFKDELMISLFHATDREVCIREFEGD